MRIQIKTRALPPSSRFPRLAAAILVSCFAGNVCAVSNGAQVARDPRIFVTAVAGHVDVTMAGQTADVAPESTVLLPARIVTGHDGTFGLTQAGTNVSVSNDTDVEIPAEAVDGNLIARLVQHRGNVFYDVAPRDVGKLRVETPLLVAVIKGTQFNVAVQPDTTTISLFEGRLEIRTPDGSDVVELTAGEIAIRSRADGEIRVVGMDDERVAAPRSERLAVAAALDEGTTHRVVDLTNAVVLVTDGITGRGGHELVVGAKPGIHASGLDLGLDAGTAVQTGTVSTSLDAGVTTGAASLDVGLDAGLDLGSGSIDVGLDGSVDVGSATVDLALDAGADLGGGAVDLGLDAGVDLGGALDADVGAALDLGEVDATVDAGNDVGSGSLDLGLDADLDLGGVLDAGLDVDLGAGISELDLGLGSGGSSPTPAPPGGSLGDLL